MNMTPRLTLPYILTNQAQKEVTHNEALNGLDAWVQPVVQSADLPAPPASLPEGGLWIVAAGGSGAWLGRDGSLAQWIGGSWRFLQPFDGASVWLTDRKLAARFESATGWVTGDVTALRVLINGQAVLGARQPAIADPEAGDVIDVEARSAIAAILGSLRQHGLIAS